MEVDELAARQGCVRGNVAPYWRAQVPQLFQQVQRTPVEHAGIRTVADGRRRTGVA